MEGYSKNHHAHIFVLNGNRPEEIMDEIESDLQTLYKGETHQSYRLVYDSFLIENAQEIASMSKSRNTSNERRFFFIGFNTGTRTAQNALLKTLEEPSSGTSFIFLVPASNVLLETVRSRCITVALPREKKLDTVFVSLPIHERLSRVQELLEDKSELPLFYAALEEEIQRLIQTNNSVEMARALSLVFSYKQPVLAHTPSLKYLLEELALTLPKTEVASA